MNLLAAFAISGLWHGAAYNFLAWGLWHGVMMVVHRFWRQWDGRPSGPIWRVDGDVNYVRLGEHRVGVLLHGHPARSLRAGSRCRFGVMGFAALVRWLEILSGSRRLPPELASRTGIAIARGCWWLVLLLLAWAFSGRTTKFVYVDF